MDIHLGKHAVAAVCFSVSFLSLGFLLSAGLYALESGSPYSDKPASYCLCLMKTLLWEAFLCITVGGLIFGIIAGCIVLGLH